MADAAPIAGLVLFIDDDTARFQQGMRQSQRVVEQSTERMIRGVRGVDQSVQHMNRTMGRFDASAFRNTAREILFAENGVKRLQSSFVLLTGTIAGFSTAQLTMQLGKVADQYTSIRNKIATVVTGQKEQLAAEEAIFNVAQKSRSSFEASAVLYQRISSAVPALAANQTQLLQTIETIQKSFLVAGATTQEAQSAAIQLAQGLASGRLQGDELRSILENNIPLAQALARELAGGSLGKLREMGEGGLLNAESVTRAILASSQAIELQFARTIPRIADGWQAIDNAFMRYVGHLDKEYGASEKMAKSLMHIAENFEEIGRAAGHAALAVAGALAARQVSGMASGVGGRWAALGANRKDAVGEAMAARAATEAMRHEAEIAEMVAKDQREGLQNKPMFRRADPQVQAEFNRAAIQVDKARMAADAAHDKEIGNIQKRVGLEGQAVQATNAVTKATSRLNDLLGQRAALMVKAQSIEGGPRSLQNKVYGSLFNEAAAKNQLAAATAHLNALQEREQKIAATVSKLQSGSPAQQRMLPLWSGRADEAAAARMAAEKQVAAAQRASDQMARQSERARDALDKARIAQTKAAGAELVAVDKQIASQRDLISKGQIAAEERRLAEQRALDQQAIQLRQARIAAEANLTRAQQQLAVASTAVGPSAARNVNTALLNEMQAAQHVMAVNRVMDANDKAIQQAKANATLLGRTMAASAATATAAWAGLSGILGGPIGMILTGGIALWSLYSYRASAAADAVRDNAAAAEAVKTALEGMENQLQKTGFVDVGSQIAAKAGIEGAEKSISDSMNKIREMMDPSIFDVFTNAVSKQLAVALNQGGVATYEFRNALSGMKAGSEEQADALKILIAELERLGMTDTNLSGPINEMLKTARAALQAYINVQALRSMLRGVAQDAAGEATKPVNMRLAREGSSSFSDDQLKAVDKETALIQKMNERRQEVEAIVGGREKEYAITKKTFELIDAAGSAYSPANFESYQQMAKDFVAAEEQLKAFNKSSRAGSKSASREQKQEESFLARLERLNEAGKASFFSDIDRELIDELQKMKANPTLIKQTREAIETGGVIPGQAKQVRDAMLLKEAGSEYRNIIEKYGTMEQLLPKITDYQTKLNLAVQHGKLSADQAAIAFADYLTKFEQFKWIDDAANAFGKFAESALMDMGNIGDAFKGLLTDIQRMLMNELVVGPLRKLVKSAITDMLTPSGGSGGIMSAIMGALGFGGGMGAPAAAGAASGVYLGGLYHTGGTVGTNLRPMPAELFKNAPRYHSGLGAKEIPAILERDEKVYTAAQDRRMGRVIDSLTDAAGGGRREGDINVQVVTPPGTKTEAQQSRGPNGERMLKVMVKQILQDDLATNGDVSQQMQGMFGLNRTRGR